MIAELAWSAVALSMAEVAVALRVLAFWPGRLGAAVRVSDSTGWTPRCAIIVPTKGHSAQLAENLRSLLRLDYPDYEVIFAIEAESDEGLPVLTELVARSGGRARVVVAGLTTGCSQQNHNMIAGARAAVGAEVLAFCDNDIAVEPHWLRSLVTELALPKMAVTTGYRWIAPRGTSWGSQTHAFINMTMFAHFAGLVSLGQPGLWGGSFALRRQDWIEWRVAERWGETISDDMTLAAIVKARKRATAFVPEVLSRTDDAETSWWKSVGWYARQLLVVKAYDRTAWWMAGAATLGGAGGALLLPVAAIAWCAGWSFAAPCGIAGAAFFAGETITLLLYTRFGPTRGLFRMIFRLPALRLSQGISWLMGVGKDSLEWAGVTYRFDRRGRVISLLRRSV